jgi:hypothetical protein
MQGWKKGMHSGMGNGYDNSDLLIYVGLFLINLYLIY